MTTRFYSKPEEGSGTRYTFWVLAIGLVALTLVLAGARLAYLQKVDLEHEISTLSQELLSSRKNVEQLIAAKVMLEGRLERLTNGARLAVPSADRGAEKTPVNDSGKEITGSLEVGEVSAYAFAQETIEHTSDVDQETAFPLSTKGEDIKSENKNPRPLQGPENSEKSDALAMVDGNVPIGWSVVVGSFSNQNNSTRLASDLEQNGYTVVVESVTTNQAELRRVKVVGFTSKDRATSAASDIASRFKTGGRLPVVLDSTTVGAIEREQDISINLTVPSVDKEQTSTAPQADPNGEEPMPLDNSSSTVARWFIYVDTFTDSNIANQLTLDLVNDGYNAKLAVEYRDETLYYRVQIIGIDSRQTGEEIMDRLVGRGDLQNIQLRKY